MNFRVRLPERRTVAAAVVVGSTRRSRSLREPRAGLVGLQVDKADGAQDRGERVEVQRRGCRLAAASDKD